MLRFAALLVVSSFLAAPALADSTDATVKITNRSSWDIHHLYISSVDVQEWGPDQLGEEVIAAGDSFTLNNIPCDAYDVQLIDEDGDECIVSAVALCADSDTWVIKDSDLLACQAETE